MNQYTIQILEDHTDEVLNATDEGIERALEAIGIQVENYAKMKCPVDTGLLRNSITHAVGGKSPETTTYSSNNTHASTEKTKKAGTAGNPVNPTKTGSYSGTAPNEKAVFVGSNVEYAAYVEVGTQKTDPQPYLKPAFMDHVDELKHIAEDALSGNL